MEDILLKNIATYKERYEYYNRKNNEEKSNEYVLLLLSEIEKLLVLKGFYREVNIYGMSSL